MAKKGNQVKNQFREKEQVQRKKKQPKFNLSFSGKEKYLKIFGLLLIGFSFFLFLAFTSFLFSWKVDQSLVTNIDWEVFSNAYPEMAKNWMGVAGAWLSHIFIYQWFGVPSYLFTFLFFILGFKFLFGQDLLPLRKSISYSLLAIFWFSIVFGLVFSNSLDFLGGAFGYFAQLWLQGVVGLAGTIIFLLLIVSGFLILTFNIRLEPEMIIQWFRGLTERPQVAMENSGPSVVMEEDFSDQSEDDPTEEKTEEKEDSKSIIEFDFEEEEEEKAPVEKEETAESKEEDELALEIETFEDVKEEVTGEVDIVHDEYDPKLDLSNYKYPHIDLLRDYEEGSRKIDPSELEEKKNLIIDTLKNYNIEIEKIKATVGPTVTLYEIVPAAGIRISKIKNLEDDIALSLAALGIRIIAPIPGKGTIGIEVPNANPEMVSLKAVLSSSSFRNSELDLPIAFGKTISNEIFITDLAKMPHLLMAGATGQGKSVGLNVIIASLLYKKHPSQIKFVMVDPKKVELSLFNKIERHFLAKLPNNEEAIITDTAKVVDTLNSLCVEMDTRYDLLKEAHVRNIREYNRKFIKRKLNPQKGHRYLPYIVLVIDELADLMMTAGKEIETPIARLAQLARAIGIHLILATQRPSVNIITGVIKANFPARIAFRVTSKIDSRTILDAGGADQLIGRGDMLFSPGGELTRIQCAFVDTDEIEEITEYIGSQQGYPNAFELPEVKSSDGESGSAADVLEDRDEMFEEAARVIVQNQQGSTSLIQRRLKLGYNRAGRIIDQLEAAGIVGPFEGSKAREVLIPDEYALEQFLTNLNEKNNS